MLILDLLGKWMVDEVLRASKVHSATDGGEWNGQPIRPLTDRAAVICDFMDLLILGDADKFSKRALPWFAGLARDDPRRETVVARYKTEIEAPLLAEVDRIAESLLGGAESQIEKIEAWARKHLDAHYRQYLATDIFMHDSDPVNDEAYRHGAKETARPAPLGWTRNDADKVYHHPDPTSMLELLVDADAIQSGHDDVLATVISVANLEATRYIGGPRKRPSRVIGKLALRRVKWSPAGGIKIGAPWAELFKQVRDAVRGQLVAKTAQEGAAIREAVATVAASQQIMEVVGYKDRTQPGEGT